MNETAQRLLDAHVAFELERLTGPGLATLLDARVAQIFEWLADVELASVVPTETVLGAIERYVIELRVSGGITELAGEMARMVLSSKENPKYSLRDVLSDRSFEDFTDKIIALDGPRRELIAMIANSTSVRELAARSISHVITDAIRQGALRVSPTHAISSVIERSLAPELETRAAHALARQLERRGPRIARLLERHLSDALQPAALRSLLDEFWSALARKPLDEVYAVLGEQDLEDFVVFCYEFWLRFRKSSYLKQLLSDGVKTFYAKYGHESVTLLIEDMGVTQDMVSAELARLLTPILAKASESGFLEGQVRALFAEFYASNACAKALVGA